MGCQENKWLSRKLTYNACIWGHFLKPSHFRWIPSKSPHPCREDHNPPPLTAYPFTLSLCGQCRDQNACDFVKYCKAASAWKAAKPQQFQACSSRSFSTSLCLTHLESGLDGSLRPEELGSKPGSSAAFAWIMRAAELSTYPRTCCFGCSRFSSTPHRVLLPFLSSFLPRLPLLHSLFRAAAQKAESSRLPPPDARAVRGANQEAPSSSRAGRRCASPPRLTLQSQEQSCRYALRATGEMGWRRRPAAPHSI